MAEHGMLKSIRVRANSRQEKLDILSRINFSKIYTVEHNVKVYDFGDVHKDHIHRLRRQWRVVLDQDSHDPSREVEYTSNATQETPPFPTIPSGTIPNPSGYQYTTPKSRKVGDNDDEDDEDDDDEDEDDEEEEDY